MTDPSRPPALDLPDLAKVRWTSITKVLREPERNWPAQLCERPAVTGEVGRNALALTADPEAARAILTGAKTRFVKWRIYGRVIGAGAGRHNISATDGETCRRQRRAFAPLFRPDALPDRSRLFAEAARRAIDEWLAPGGAVRIDAGLEMTRIALDTIWRLMFDFPPDAPATAQVDRVARQAYAAQAGGRINESGALFETLVQEARCRPRTDARTRSNPFTGLGRTPSPGGLSEEEIYDNARLFLNAGQETTALTLTWALWLVGRDPSVRQRLHEEIDAVTRGAPVSHQHLGDLVFTGQVINETLRLFPSGPIIMRQATGEETLCGETLPPGGLWAVCLYALHRHKGLWSDPDDFRPDRFAPGSDEPRNRFAFLPFGAGRHVCVGAAFGWAEAMTVFAAILQAFEVESDPSVEVRPRMAITLRPDRETPVTLRPRRVRSPG